MPDRDRIQYLATLAEGMSIEELNMLVLLKGLNILANAAVDAANDGDSMMADTFAYDCCGIGTPTVASAIAVIDDMVHGEEMERIAKEVRYTAGINVCALFAIKRTPTSGYSYSTVRP